MIDERQLPGPRRPPGPTPREVERLAECIHLFHDHLGDGIAGAADFHERVRCSHRTLPVHMVDPAFNGEKQEMRKDLMAIAQGGTGIVAPPVAKIPGEKGARTIPVPLLDFF